MFALAGGYYGWKSVKRAMRPTFDGPKKKVVILGSGWGALSVINHLTPGQFDVTVVSPRNYFLFTPLLPSVTVGTVEARSIVEPLRKLIRKVHGSVEGGFEFLESECVDIDPLAKRVRCEDRSGIVGAVSEVYVSISQQEMQEPKGVSRQIPAYLYRYCLCEESLHNHWGDNRRSGTLGYFGQIPVFHILV